MNEDALQKLENLQSELSTNRNDFSQKLEILAAFVDQDLKYIIKQVENGYERIEELSDELEEANGRIEELESEQNATV